MIEGDLKNRRYVEHLRFLGLTLAHSNWAMTRRGQALRPVGSEPGRGRFGDRRAEPGVRRLRRAPRGHLCHGLRGRLPRQPHRELRAGRHGRRGHQDRPRRQRAGAARAAIRRMLASHHTVRQCLIAHGGRMHAGGGRRLDRRLPLQRRRAQRHLRLLPDRRLRGLDLGLRTQPGPSQRHRLQPHPHARPRRALGHGRRLHPGRLARHPRPRQPHATTSAATATVTAAGASTPTRAPATS